MACLEVKHSTSAPSFTSLPVVSPTAPCLLLPLMTAETEPAGTCTVAHRGREADAWQMERVCSQSVFYLVNTSSHVSCHIKWQQAVTFVPRYCVTCLCLYRSSFLSQGLQTPLLNSEGMAVLLQHCFCLRQSLQPRRGRMHPSACGTLCGAHL